MFPLSFHLRSARLWLRTLLDKLGIAACLGLLGLVGAGMAVGRWLRRGQS